MQLTMQWRAARQAHPDLTGSSPPGGIAYCTALQHQNIRFLETVDFPAELFV